MAISTCPSSLCTVSGAAFFLLCIEGFSLYPACFLLPALLQTSQAPVVDISCLPLSVGHLLVLTQTAL